MIKEKEITKKNSVTLFESKRSIITLGNSVIYTIILIKKIILNCLFILLISSVLLFSQLNLLDYPLTKNHWIHYT